MTWLAPSVELKNLLKYLQGAMVILLIAGMVILFSQKERILNHLSDASASSNHMDSAGREAFRYYDAYDMKKAGVRFKGTLLEFGAKNCLSCRKMEEVIEEMRNEYGHQIAIQFINITEKKGLEEGRQFGVLMIPMQVLIDRHGKVVQKHTGSISAADLSALIESKLLGN